MCTDACSTINTFFNFPEMHKPILIVLLFKVDFFGLLKDSWTQSSISYSYRITVFLRGAGGFSTSSPPFSYSERKSQLNLTPLSKPSVLAQELPPDIVVEEQTHPSQALLYRLSGDYNPLHSDPSYAKAAGFPRPILHGLCTFGYATRAIIQFCCGGEPTLIQSVQGRFLLHVFPGETLVTEIWQNKKESVATFKLKVKERGKVVLSGTVRLHPSGSRL
jgi:peroxisomal enoyl-CoA hydratase 2